MIPTLLVLGLMFLVPMFTGLIFGLPREMSATEEYVYLTVTILLFVGALFVCGLLATATKNGEEE